MNQNFRPGGEATTRHRELLQDEQTLGGAEKAPLNLPTY